jgi:hypothetical protein
MVADSEPIHSKSAPQSDEAEPARDDPGRNESKAERDDQNLTELIQELRVAGLGIQVLFGFLLSLPFTVRFATLSDSQRNLYVITLLLAGLSTALLGGPVAYHRLVFRQHKKGRLIQAANVMAIAGVAAVGLAVSSAVSLVTSLVYRGAAVPTIAASTFATFAGLWFVLPVVNRGRVHSADSVKSPVSRNEVDAEPGREH